ncbi:hypothetical protein [Cryobacterium sp. SO1]|uniref:hypothetical protein n=1 Tax=Cryobacterium sp. SO1 TaxID=1897061 RepID=UPI001022ABC2|nr:hypothetical protein [Cryobacterium sp. SO1]RZI36503.1 hypothetical protein BJQ95_01089 [Cryobacterium sp. SO1]
MTITSRYTYAAAMLLALTLTGCSASASSTNVLAPSARSASAVPTPTPTAIPGDTDGDGTLSEFEKQVAAQNAPRDYALPDGTVVSIDPKVPLPAEVVAAIRGQFAEYGAYALALSSHSDVSEQQARSDVSATFLADLDALAEALGKGIVLTYQAQSSVPGGGEETLWVCTASKGQYPVQALADGDKFNADVQAWAASRGYEVIYIQ